MTHGKAMPHNAPLPPAGEGSVNFNWQLCGNVLCPFGITAFVSFKRKTKNIHKWEEERETGSESDVIECEWLACAAPAT